MSALDACILELRAGRSRRREQVRNLTRFYDRHRFIVAYLPRLCDRPLDPMRNPEAFWSEDRARVTKLLMREIVAEISATLFGLRTAGYRLDRAVLAMRLDALRSALAAEWRRYRFQRMAELIGSAAE